MSQTCGFVAIVGRPNVGKSTLMNRILGQKISITSRRPQTTRHQVMGIKTENETQFIYVDTPGMHIMSKDRNKAINRFMNQAATQALRDVDCVVFIIDRTRWTEEDQAVLKRLEHVKAPVILAVRWIPWKRRWPSISLKVFTSSQKTRLPIKVCALWPLSWCEKKLCASWATSFLTR